MNLKWAGLLGLAYILSLPLQAQTSCSLSLAGIVQSDAGEPLLGATIVLNDGRQSTVTDAHGHYRFSKLCAGVYSYKIQFVGFVAMDGQLTLSENMVQNFSLTADVAQLDEVIVRAHQPHTEHVHNSITLNGKQLAEAAGKSLGETLKEIPGVNTIQAGPGIFKPVIHGLHGQRILILNYGIRQEGQQWGAEHAPEIDPFIASNVVVIKDASAIKYGTDALGGVIVINPPELTDKPGLGGKFTSVGQLNGRMGTLSGYLEGGIKNHDGWGWRVQGTAKHGGDFNAPGYSLTNTGARELNYSAAAGLHREKYGVEVFFSGFNTTLGILGATSTSNLVDLVNAMERSIPQGTKPFAYSIAEPRQEVSHHLFKLNAHAERASGEWRLQYGYQNNQRQEFDLRRGNLLKIPALNLLLQTHTLETEWEMENAAGRILCVGVTGMAQDNANIPGTNRIPFIPNFVNYSGGAFGVAQQIIGKWKLDAGLRYDYRFYRIKGFDYRNNYFQDALSFGNVSATAGATVQWKHDRIDLNMSTAWRPPHVAELYSLGVHQSAAGIEYGLLLDATTNEVRSIDEVNFRNEQAVKAIATWQRERKQWQWVVSGYVNRIANFIFLKPSGITENIRGALPFFRYDQTNVLMVGADASASIQVVPSFKVFGTAAVLRAHNLGNTGELPYIVPNRFDVGGRWQQTETSKHKFFFETKVRMVMWQRNSPRVLTPRQFLDAANSNVDLLENDNRNFDFAEAPAGYALLGAATGFSVKTGESRLDFRVSIENALNTSYREYTNRFRYFANDLGRNFFLSIQYQL